MLTLLAPPSPLVAGNCQAFLGRDVDVDVVSRLDAAGTTWQVDALRTDGRGRAAVLSGTAPTLHGAFEELHRRSARALDRHVAANGFDAGPGRRRADKGRRGRRCGARDASTDGSASDDSGSASAGEDDDWQAEDVAAASERGPGLGLNPAKRRARPATLPGFDAGQLGCPVGLRPPPPGLLGGPGRGAGGAAGGGGGGGGRAPAPAAAMPMSTMGTGPGRRGPVPPAAPLTPAAPPPRSMLLTVDWAGHGRATFADECALSVAAVRRKVRALLARRAGEFGGGGGSDGDDAGVVEVCRVCVDGLVFVLTGADDCLATAVASAGPALRAVHVFVDVGGAIYDDD